jgi:hypothetical protein
MNKIKTISIALVCLTVMAGAFIANASLFGVERQRSHIILMQTANIINVAHKCVKEHKVFTGNLAKAIGHQHVALEYYGHEKYFEAMWFSRRARALAIKAIEANGCIVPGDDKFLDSDAEFFKNCPSDEELDNRLTVGHPKEKMKDEEVIKSKPDVEVK